MNKDQSISLQESTETAQQAVKPSGNKKGPDGLTATQRMFLVEYLKDGNATKAATRAGYSADTAASQGSRLLKNAKIKQAIQQAQQEVLEAVKHETGITLERTLREIARLAFFDPRQLFGADGNPLSIQDLSDDTAAAVAGLDVLEEFEGAGKDRIFVGYTKKYKLADKKAALDMLMKHLGGYGEDNGQQGKAAAGTLAGLLQSMRGSGLKVVKKVDSTDE